MQFVLLSSFSFLLWEPHVKEIQSILSRARKTPEVSLLSIKVNPQINVSRACKTDVLEAITSQSWPAPLYAEQGTFPQER